MVSSLSPIRMARYTKVLPSRRHPRAPSSMPATFGKFANALLVGNFGDGRISAFEPTSGKFLGRLRNTKGEILSIDGLWAITQGGGAGTTPDEILFTAGPNDEANGLFGKLNP